MVDGKLEPMDVKVGDKVIYSRFVGNEIKLDDDEVMVVSQKDILAIIEE